MEFLRLASELTGEVGKLAVDAANYANTTVNQMASTAISGVAGLGAAAAEAVTGGDPGAAFTAVSKGVAEKTTLPTMPAQSTVGKALAGAAGVAGQHMAAGQQELQYTVGDYWRTLAEEEGMGAGATVVGGVGAAIAAGAETAIDLVSRTGVPKNTGGAPRQILAGRRAIDPELIQAAEKSRFIDKATNYGLIKTHGIYMDIQGQWRKWISDDGAKIDMSVFPIKKGGLDGTTHTVRAADFIQHPDLFKYYPEAADMEIEITFDPDNVEGKYSPLQNKLFITAPAGDQKAIITTALHELQHKVQDVEDIAGGSNELDFVRPHVIEPLGLDTKRNEIVDQINAYYSGNPHDLTPEDLSDMQRAAEALSSRKLYRMQLGEKEAFRTEELYGEGMSEKEAAKAMLDESTRGEVNTIKQGPANMEEFLDNYPSLWGQYDVLKYFVDDPALLKKYGNAQHFGLENARKRKRDAKPVTETSTGE